MKIPRLIHQIYDSENAMPVRLSELAETWQTNHPEWEYTLWSKNKISRFIADHPEHAELFHSLRYNLQKWEFLRYLILYYYGGLYVDVDCESVKNIEPVIDQHECCFALEPSSHAQRFGREYMLGNSFMASIPNHPFIKRIIDRIKPDTEYSAYCYSDIMQTTGIIMLNEVYEQFRNDYSIGLLPETQVEPFSAQEISDYLNNRNVDIMERYANKTFAIHYHLGLWRLC